MKVAIFFGSASDTDTMKKASAVLKDFGVEYNAWILSAHRSGELLKETINQIENEGYEVIIAGAGLAAHLPGVIASMTVLPVIGGCINNCSRFFLNTLMDLSSATSVSIDLISRSIAGAINLLYESFIASLIKSVIPLFVLLSLP